MLLSLCGVCAFDFGSNEISIGGNLKMYLTEDPIYLPAMRKQFTSSEELSNYIEQKVGQEGSSLSDGRCTPFRETVLIITYLCEYITREELSTYFGSLFSSSSKFRLLDRLVDEKLLKTCRFPIQDSYSRRAYCLTDVGADAIGTLLPLSSRHKIVQRRNGGVVPEHDYSIGINILHFIISDLTFIWRKEFVLSSGSRHLASVQSDGIISVSSDIQPRIFYLEQDMGNETIGMIVEKISAYGNMAEISSDDRSCILFSMRTVPDREVMQSVSLSGSAKPLIELIKRLESEYLSSHGLTEKNALQVELWDFYQYFKNLSGFDDQDKYLLLFHQLFYITGTAAADCSFSQLRSSSHMRHLPDRSFTYQDLLQYDKDSNALCNPYRIVRQNKVQHFSAFGKELSMLKLLVSYIRRGLFMRDEARALLTGLQTFVVPTDLLCNYFPYIMPAHYRTTGRIIDALSGYYKFLDDPYRDQLRIDRDESAVISLTLRNVLLCEDTAAGNPGIVTFADITNISAVLQAYFLSRHGQDAYPFIHFVFLCDTKTQALRLSEQVYLFPSDRYVRHTGVQTYFMEKADFNKKNALFSVIRYKMDNSDEYGVVEALPPVLHDEIYETKEMSVEDLAKKLFGNMS